MTIEELKPLVDKFIEPFLIVVGFLVIFYNSYFSERAKNIATKKDIKKITRKIETVKSDIEVLKENQIGFQALRREAIVSYFEKLNLWKNLIYNMEFENTLYLDTKVKMDQLALDTSNAESRLKLYIDNFSEHELLINEVFVSIKKIQDRYLIDLNQFNSITSNIHLKQPILDKFTKWSEAESDIVNPKIEELIIKLRKLIRNNPK